jgi:thiamine-phosphate pyrophosphorylase
MPQLYAIAGTIERARFFLRAGAPVMQLRFKDRPLAPLWEEVRSWARDFPATRIVINDDLEFAVSAGVWGAHLGQEDVRRYPPGRVAGAAVKVGISTHSDEEIALAKRYRPALLGFGPVFATSSKELTHAPQGVERLREVVQTSGLPIIAIGGIGEENLDQAAATGCAYVAMIAYLDRCKTEADVKALMARLAGMR